MMDLNITILDWDQLEHWWKYYIYLRYVELYKNGLIQEYKGPHFSKESIDDIYHKFSTQVDGVIENAAKWLIQNIITASISVTYDKSNTSYYIDNEEDKEEIEKRLKPFPSCEMILRSNLLKLYQELDDAYTYEEWDELKNDLPVELLYQKLIKLANKIKRWELINYYYIFNEYLSTFIKYYESDEDIDLEILAESILALTDSFDELLEEYWEHPKSFMYNELLKLSQSVDGIDNSSNNLWKSVSILYNDIINLGNSLNMDLRIKVINWDAKMDDSEDEDRWDEEDLSDPVFDKLGQIINAFFSDSAMKIKWSQTIKDIFDTFDSLYFSEEYLRDNIALSENPLNSDIDIDDLHNNFDNYIVILSTFSLSKLEDIKKQLVEKEHYESVRKVDPIMQRLLAQ